MSNKEHYWAWLHPSAEEEDRFAMPGGGTALVLRKEEVAKGERTFVRFLISQEGEKLVLPQWTTPVPKGVPPHLRRDS
jgi:ABC-type Fe3+ transport system substrate-binding protein